MSINDRNADTELNDVNVGALAITDGNNNDNDNNEGDDDVSAAELLGVPEDHPMAQFFNLTDLTEKVVLSGGVQVAGKIRCTNSRLWKMFGGDDNWNKLLAVYTLPLVYRDLGLGALDAAASMDYLWTQLLAIRAGSLTCKCVGLDNLDAVRSMSYLKRLNTDAPADPAKSPKPFSEYAFEIYLQTSGCKLHWFIPQGVLGQTLVLPLDDKYERKCGKFDDDLKPMLNEDA